MARVILVVGAVVGVALGLMLPAPSHLGQHHTLIVPGSSAR